MNRFVLFVIVLLAFSMRFYRLDLNVPTIYGDEASHYLHFNVMQTCTKLDPTCFFVQIFRHLFSFSWIFGVTPLGARAASAFYGSLLVICSYLLAKSFSKNRALALSAALLAAITPWSFMISRIGHTHIPIVVGLVLLHLALFIKAATIKEYLYSFIPLGISIIFYPTGVFIAPFSLAVFFLEFLKPNWEKYQRLSIFLFFLIPLVAVSLTFRYKPFSGNSRFLDLAIWRDINTTAETDRYRGLSGNPSSLPNRILYNRLTANISIFTKNYLTFYSPDWLFLKGDPILRHSTGQVGELYVLTAPFILLGLYFLIKRGHRKTKLIIIAVIVASPIQSAITKDGAGYLLRGVTLLPILDLLAVSGLFHLLSILRRRLRLAVIGVTLLIFAFSCFSFLYGYFYVYPALSQKSYEYGFKELADFQAAKIDAPLLVIWSGYYPNIVFRFWQNTNYQEYLSWQLKKYDFEGDTYWQTFPNLYFSDAKNADGLDKFVNTHRIRYVALPNRYFVNYPENIKEKLSKTPIMEIKYIDSTNAFTIYEK